MIINDLRVITTNGKKKEETNAPHNKKDDRHKDET